MTREELVQKTKQLIATLNRTPEAAAVYSQGAEFLRTYGGPKNAFLETLKNFIPRSASDSYIVGQVVATVEAFLAYVEAGLNEEISPERRAQLDVVSDFLEQAQTLLETKGVHPAAPAVIIGAVLEEFLRTWVEGFSLSIGNRKPSLEAYSDTLREADLISKQDAKDITSWGGIRNHAAHGEWEEVEDKKRVSLMLEGVNLFMRRYGTTKDSKSTERASTSRVAIE